MCENHHIKEVAIKQRRDDILTAYQDHLYI